PEFVQQGALVSVGIGWYQTGYAAAKAVARVLRGESPQGIPFENIAVKQLELNHEVARTLGVTFPPALIKEATNAQPPASPKPQAWAPLAKKWQISLIELVNSPNVEESRAGVLAGLREAGLVEGRDYVAHDHFDGGRESALLAARVMRGESPGAIPFSLTKKIKLVLNPAAASAYGLTLPPALLKRADVVIGQEQ
ncbi:MAG TPA: ABC transporter substrate binding protein, partial [Candidatus Binatia bacterium]|nr:ABC transporter substrate binding protein [Candidatus Binatia bacterium]